MAVYSPTRTGDPLTNKNLDQISTALASIPTGIGSSPTWIAPPIIASLWAGVPGFAAAGYCKDAGGVVWVKGKLKNVSGGALGGNWWTLPVGHRPLEGREFLLWGWTGAALTTYFGQLLKTGELGLAAGTTIPGNAQVHLMLSFPAEA